jgi:hypothetical protein
MKPYSEVKLDKNQYIRSFSSKVKTEELEWHLDREDRVIDVLENDGGWMIQLDNKLPSLLKETIFIPKETYHRVIKGTGGLVVRITKLYESDSTKHTG